MSFADTLGAYGAILNLPEGAGTTTLESKTQFFRPAGLGTILGESVPLHLGRRTMVWQTSLQNDDGLQIALITQTQMILEGEELSEGHLKAMMNSAPRLGPVETVQQQAVSCEEQRNSVAADRRAQILTAAFSVILKKGFGNASMREIARAAGMPVPTMYQYVRSKDEILAGIFENYLKDVEAEVAASAERPGDAASKLRAAVTANLEQFDRHQAEIRVMNRETRALQPEVRARVKDQMRGYLGQLERIVKDGIANGEFRDCDPKIVANLVAMLCEVWPLRQWSVGTFGLERVRNGIVDLVMNGIQRDSEKGK